jgi:hypothetical protein
MDNPTRAGRILIYVALVLAFGMAVWSWGLYSSRIDYKVQQDKRKATINDLWKQLTGAEERQAASLFALRTSEARRPLHQQFYTAELDHLRTTATAANPIRIVTGQRTPEGLPVMGPAPFMSATNQPLQSMTRYQDELNSMKTDALASIAQYQKLVDTDSELIGQIVGEKGLRQEIFNEEDVKQARIKQEIEDLKPLYVNVLVEGQLLQKRQRALQARIKELEEKAARTTER